MRRLTVLTIVTGLFLIVMIAAAVQGLPQINPPLFKSQQLPPPVQTAEPMPSATPAPLPEASSNLVGTIIGIIFLLLAGAAAVLVLVLVIRALLRAWRDRPMRFRDGSAVASDLREQPEPTEPEVAAPVIRRGIEGALRIIDERAVPTDAIVAAWIGLEESAADAGLARGASETASEFALRIITRRAGISDAAQQLLRLYESVRFGAYTASEDDRAIARAALKLIEKGWQ